MPETRTSIPRIRAVRFKAGGEVRLLKNPREGKSRELEADLYDAADELIETHKDKIAGFALVMWTADGDAGGHLRNTQFSTLPHSALPELTADVIRRILVADQIADRMGDNDEIEGA